MENELTYTPVTDNSLLEFGETRIPLGDDNTSDRYDITSVFEDGLSFGQSKIASVSLSTNGYLNLLGPAGYNQGQISALSIDLDTRESIGLDEDAGVYFDINEERDSVVLTWNKVGLYAEPDGPRQTFQAEIIDKGDDDAEIILRWANTDGQRYYNASLNSYHGSYDLNNVLNLNDNITPLADLDTRIGNTGISGVEQILLADGEPLGFTIFGTDEAEVLSGGLLSDNIDGAGGNDTITGAGSQDTITGGDGDDEITATQSGRYNHRDDKTGASLDGGLGDDTIRASDLFDTITGGDGDDLINGGHGSNDISGGAGNDIIRFGYHGDSTIGGGNGDDYIDGSFLDGQRPNITYYSTRHADIQGGQGNDTILGTRVEDVIAGQEGNDSVLAGGGRDEIFGGEGDDILTAGSRDDTIDGGAGDDFIFGAFGRDVATGGTGADRFFVSGQQNDTMHIIDYNYDEGDFLVLDGDLIDRDSIELHYSSALTADGIQTRGYEIGVRDETGFQKLFTFGNEAQIEKILLRLPAEELDPKAPILFDLGDLIA